MAVVSGTFAKATKKTNFGLQIVGNRADNDILLLLATALPVAFREAASVIALEAETLVMGFSRTFRLLRGIKAGMLGRRAFVQTEWPGIAVDRPHRIVPRGPGVKGRMSNGRDEWLKANKRSVRRGRATESVEGKYYMEDAWIARRDQVMRILANHADEAARKQVYKLPTFTRKPAGANATAVTIEAPPIEAAPVDTAAAA